MTGVLAPPPPGLRGQIRKYAFAICAGQQHRSSPVRSGGTAGFLVQLRVAFYTCLKFKFANVWYDMLYT